MSDSALQDLSVAQSVVLEKTKDGSVKACSTKPALNGKKCVDKEEDAPLAFPDTVTNGCEAGIVDVEYIDSENLTDLPDVDMSLSTLLTRLDSKDWVRTCEALNNVRQLAIYHKERLQELLEPLVPLIVKSVKNPRSAVCKTALMTCADIFKAYGELMVDSIDLLNVKKIKKVKCPVLMIHVSSGVFRLRRCRDDLLSLCSSIWYALADIDPLHSMISTYCVFSINLGLLIGRHIDFASVNTLVFGPVS